MRKVGSVIYLKKISDKVVGTLRVRTGDLVEGTLLAGHVEGVHLVHGNA